MKCIPKYDEIYSSNNIAWVSPCILEYGHTTMFLSIQKEKYITGRLYLL